jgi:hypothetical protein
MPHMMDDKLKAPSSLPMEIFAQIPEKYVAETLNVKHRASRVFEGLANFSIYHGGRE